MTALDEIIDGSVNPAVSTPNLLRKTLIVAHRLQATEVVAWVRKELNGYKPDDDLPSYRNFEAEAVGTFVGYGGAQITKTLPRTGDEDVDWFFEVSLRQTVSEIQALTTPGENDQIGIAWDPFVVIAYEETKVFGIENYTLFSVRSAFSKQSLYGILEIIRNLTLDFALELQAVAPSAGQVGGPTLESSPEVSQVVNNYYYNNFAGDGASVSFGDHSTQSTTVIKNDLTSFVAALKELGLSSYDATEFAEMVKEEASIEGGKVKAFLAKAGSGAIKFSTGIASKVASTRLTELAMEFLNGAVG